MAKFRKKPVVIEAIQWTGGNYREVANFCDCLAKSPVRDAALVAIDTLEGVMLASVGDWIIKGVAGEFYPCKPDIFAATYDFVEE